MDLPPPCLDPCASLQMAATQRVQQRHSVFLNVCNNVALYSSLYSTIEDAGKLIQEGQ